MKFTHICAATAVLSAASIASADFMEASYDWSDGGTILGSYGNVGDAVVVNDPLGGSDNVLQITEDPIGGTPQAFVCWITGLSDGDVIDASFFGYGHNDTGDSSVRIWAHYTTGDDINAYKGSAGGNSAYSGAEWTELGNNWTFDSNSGDRSALVIEARIYTTSGDNGSTYVKDLYASVTGDDLSGVSINMPQPIPAPGVLALLGVVGLAGSRRRRNA
jgi:MYXO-CTERM domain-containing protein